LGRRPLQRRMHLPLGAGCGDWRRLIAMALPYRGSLRLFRLIWKRNWLKMSISGDWCSVHGALSRLIAVKTPAKGLRSGFLAQIACPPAFVSAENRQSYPVLRMFQEFLSEMTRFISSGIAPAAGW